MTPPNKSMDARGGSGNSLPIVDSRRRVNSNVGLLFES